jgi:ferredoxin
MAKIIYYRNKCIGCGVCFELQPELWRMSKRDGKATLLRSCEKKEVYLLAFSPGIHHEIQKVSLACPVKSIKIS